MGGGVLGILRLGPWDKFSSLRYTPAMSRQLSAVRPRGVLAGGEVAGGDGLVGHELRDPGNSLGGEVHDGRRWITTGDGEVRRPWRHRRSRRRASEQGDLTRARALGEDGESI
jgi:hypothetical protein